jgi:hypothetical protein
MGKGDTRRKSQVPEEQVKSNWERIFNKRGSMSSKNDFLEQHEDTINQEWSCYCNEINSIRHKYGLDSKVFTENDKERFAISYIESHIN